MRPRHRRDDQGCRHEGWRTERLEVTRTVLEVRTNRAQGKCRRGIGDVG